jgi:RIMS-binding protein 2
MCYNDIISGVPDPPVSVQVESGPQEGSILLTWLPVTIDTSGYSNGASVSGYNVYADGQKIKHVHGATSKCLCNVRVSFCSVLTKNC